MLKKLQDKAGWFAIETVILSGLMIALCAWVFHQIYIVGEDQTNYSVEKIYGRIHAVKVLESQM